MKNKNLNYYRSANLDENESIDMVDRYILLCLMLGLQDDGDISTISIAKIQSYCDYTDSKGKEHTFGEIRIKDSIARLEAAKRIKVLPQPKGKCTKYKILLPEHYEKINMQFFKKNISPAAKGYILCHLQHNKNKDQQSHQPNNLETRCDYNIDYMKDLFHDSTGRIRRAEKELETEGLLTLKDTGKHYNANHFPIVERVLNLDKVGLAEFVVKAIVQTQEQIQDMKEKVLYKDEFEKMLDDVLAKKGLIPKKKTIELTPEEYEF